MLEAINIKHTFYRNTPFSRQAINGVGLHLRPGETVLLTGPSGSGKTTLARILAGLLQPVEGNVRLNGVDLYDRKGIRVSGANLVVMACQYPERQFFAKNVREELSWGLRMGLGMKGAEVSNRLGKTSADLAFPLTELANSSPRHLSFGQQRKAALVSLLALDPQVLILDEPLAGLNARERNRLSAVLQHRPKGHRSMLIVAHELELFLNWVGKVAVMMAGRLVYWGSPTDLCQTTDSNLRAAISLPPLVELSFYLKKYGLSEGPVSGEAAVVRQQLKEALAKLLRNRPPVLQGIES
jgi:energy-coupling factor transport system ATP-binding protein